MTEFLPKGFEPTQSKSKSSRYLNKFEIGKTKVRIMGSMESYFEYFNTENKPVRSKSRPVNPKDISDDRFNPGKKSPIYEVWAMTCYDYSSDEFKILQIKQPSLQDALYNLVQDESWGSPFGYDITITREGEKLTTRYSLQPTPPKPMPTDLVKRFAEEKIDVKKLLTNGNPFGEDKEVKEEFKPTIKAEDLPF